MAQPAEQPRYTYAEYLERERETGIKHEFINGQIYAMAGGTLAHARLIFRLGLMIGNRLPQTCEAFSSDAKLRSLESDIATYPDLAVVCGKVLTHPEDPNAFTNPKVLVEVLSPSTEAYDRGQKWAHYRRIPSLEAYVLVNQAPVSSDAPDSGTRLEVFERLPSGEWVHRVANVGERLRIHALDLEIDVDALYAGAGAL